MEYSKLLKLSPLIGVYAFYNVFATANPADPWTAMKNAITAFAADPITKIKSKTSNLTTLAIVIIAVPLLTKSFKLPAAVKMVVKLLTYYIIGDQLAALLNGPGRFGAIGGQSSTWGGQTSAYHQYRPTVGTVNSSSYMSGRR